MFILAIQIIIHMKNNFLLPLIITLVVSSSTVKSQNSWSQTYPIASSLGEELNDMAQFARQWLYWSGLNRDRHHRKSRHFIHEM
jgi:hypothetical protein